jgi:glyoxylase-like metal-dependent hydrolase (beta-lactamase superfamily II)
MHFDHAGGTSRFPKARFIVQRRELEYAAGALPHNSAARGAFVADDVLALVQLNWQGRVLLVDGDAESVVPEAGDDLVGRPFQGPGLPAASVPTVLRDGLRHGQ